MERPDPPTDAPPLRRSWRRRHPLAAGVLAGLAGTGAIGLIALVVVAVADRPTPLTEAAYAAAAARWDAKGPASYDLDVELGGRRAGHIHVEVREGEVTRMTRDGVQPSQQRTWYYWSVPGQFDTIELEMEMARDPASSYGVSGAAQVALWAEFDPEFGYPKSFDRVVLGADLEVHWKVTSFRVVSGVVSENEPPGRSDLPGQ